MYWQDEGFLLSKNNFDENSIIIDAFTLNHGKYTGVVYGGASRKQKRFFQIGNKILLNWKSKSENKPGYFNIELIKPISPFYFDDKRRSICILSAASILKILLPERQLNTKIFNSFEKMLDDLNSQDWIKMYIYWELSLIRDLGFEINFINNPINNKDDKDLYKYVKDALIFNKNLLMENFIIPNKLKLPLSRNILENYY